MNSLESVDVAEPATVTGTVPRPRPAAPVALDDSPIGASGFEALPYAVTIFVSAFLVFQIQPVVAKYLLPWFGGSAAVWTTCLLFFQVMLLAGYAYAHIVSKAFGRAHIWVHLGLLAATLFFLPVRPDRSGWPSGADGSPTSSILLLLTASVGLPYLALSSTGPLLQSWFGRSYPRRSPYRLYALSNAGSLLALVSYPLLIEPLVTRGGQVVAWSAGYALFVAASAFCAFKFMRWDRARGTAGAAREAALAVSARPAATRIVSWLGLAACASALLMAMTHQMSQDVAAIPFLWVLPLAIYLVTLILCFQNERFYDRRLFGPLLVIALAIAIYALGEANGLKLKAQILNDLAVLWICCMVCHGEMVRKRPAPEHLTLFYLTVAAGGALGGVGVAVVAPAVFNGFWEYHIALAACFVFPAMCAFTDGLRSRGRRFRWIAGAAIVLIGGAAVYALALDVRAAQDNDVARSRSFYGVLRVNRAPNGPLSDSLALFNGRIKHGIQFVSEASRTLPTTYYGPDSGIGLTLLNPARRAGGPLRVGTVGLGIGTIAAYGRTGDQFRFYEIDPAVAKFARERFTYLSQSRATVDVVLGDARRRLEEEVVKAGTERYDVLAIDAFSGDAIPTHLLTAECADIYERLLRPDGVLLFHITNRYVDLKPVVTALAGHLGRSIEFVTSRADERTGRSQALWAVLAHGDGSPGATTPSPSGASVLWTDEYASLFPLLKFH